MAHLLESVCEVSEPVREMTVEELTGAVLPYKKAKVDDLNKTVRPCDVVEEEDLEKTVTPDLTRGYICPPEEEEEEEGSVLDDKNVLGQTALHIAAKNNQTEVVIALLGAGANANAKDNNGETALMLASKEGNIGVVKELLRFNEIMRGSIWKYNKWGNEVPRVRESAAAPILTESVFD
jgi:hypothetical protein